MSIFTLLSRKIYCIIIPFSILCTNDSIAVWIDTHVPSSVGGTEGIYVRIHLPDTVRYIYEGAPVVIFLSGGNNRNGVDSSSRYTRYGFISVQFNYPGGVNSGGVYDNRGINCITALKDVIKFSTGQLSDTGGFYLHDLTSPKSPSYSNVGLMGSSNGGNISLVVSGMFGDEINLAWIVNWESPVGPGMAGGECGVRFSANSNPWVNPAYNSVTGVMDYSKLRWSDTVTIGSGVSTYHGGFYFDINGNNIPNRGTDFIVNPYFVPNPPFGNKGYMSTTICQEATDRGIFPAFPPEHVPTLSEAESFWSIRLGNYWIDSSVNKLSDIMFMVTGSDTDHVQTAPDHPHIFIQYEEFRTSGVRFDRLNPDRAYIEYVVGAPRPTARDNTAFTYYDHLTIRNTFEPETISDLQYQSAAICEMADRTYMNDVRTQLNSVINTVSSLYNINVMPEGFYDAVSNHLNMNDTATVYLRQSISPYLIIDSATSVIDSLTFTGNFLFRNASSGTYYIAVKHRNSIETWSKAGGEAFTYGALMNFDFTLAQSQAFGNNLSFKGSKYCLYSGDVNQDGIIDGSDVRIIDNDAIFSATGYKTSDISGDGIVDATDLSLADNNSYNFISIITP